MQPNPAINTASNLAARYQAVLGLIASAAERAGRDPGSIQLVVVTKGHPVAVVQAALAAGIRIFGENYAEEGVAKIAALNEVPGLEWHMIGHVQSRKAQLVTEHFTRLHSLDSLKLAQRLERFAAERGRSLPVLLECNVSGEQSKFGWPAWDQTQWPALAEQLAALQGLPHLQVGGLMTMAPYFDDPEAARPSFRRLKQLQAYLADALPGMNFNDLSMGMSGDFEAAIQEGATIVRIGTAILGPRSV